MSFDITSWDADTYANESIPKIIENFRALKEDGIIVPPIASVSEVQAGEDNTKAVTPYTLAQSGIGTGGSTGMSGLVASLVFGRSK